MGSECPRKLRYFVIVTGLHGQQALKDPYVPLLTSYETQVELC